MHGFVSARRLLETLRVNFPTPLGYMNASDSQAMGTVKALIATWKLVSWTRRMVETGEEADAFGANPGGFLNYAADGRMMVLIVKGDRKTPRALPPTDQEKVALYDSIWAYAGTYTVDREKIIHCLEMTSNQIWTGIQQIRFYKLEGKELRLTTPVIKDPADGRDSIHTIVWNKID